ncbi:hypothetical protein NMG60_11006766 [Bertholletia excelsa]
MGESACLMQPFSYTSGLSNEANQGNPMRALGDSVSFGRFMSDSLSWEKWSTFSHNRYVEEAERYAQPGSVAQKKAFFEAHYKSIAAKKAAALLEQANADNTSPNPDPDPDPEEFEGQACDSTTAHDSQSPITISQVPIRERNESNNADKKVDSVVDGGNICDFSAEMEADESGKVKEAESVTEPQVEEEKPMKNEPVTQLDNCLTQNVISENGLGESPRMEKPLLKGFKSRQEAASPVTKKKSELSSSKPLVHCRAPKVPASPAKTTASVHSRKENNVTPIARKSPKASVDKKKTSKPLHALIYSTPAKEPDKSATPAAQRAESSRVAPISYKTSRDCKTPLRTPLTTYANGLPKIASATPCSENRRSKTPLEAQAPGSKPGGPKWNILSSVYSKSLTACRNKLQSPTLSVPFNLRTEERAARRKQKLEEKFNAKEEQKVQLQTRLKEKAETELKKLRQSFCFKARPLPDFYKEREASKDQKKNVKAPLTHLKSPKPGRKPSSNKVQSINAPPQERCTTKNNGSRNVLKGRSRIPNPLTSLSNENTSPNIQPSVS